MLAMYEMQKRLGLSLLYKKVNGNTSYLLNEGVVRLTLPTKIKQGLLGKKFPLTVDTHNIGHVFWRELMVKVNGKGLKRPKSVINPLETNSYLYHEGNKTVVLLPVCAS